MCPTCMCFMKISRCIRTSARGQVSSFEEGDIDAEQVEREEAFGAFGGAETKIL